MVMEPIQITVSGWKARQEAAKRKMANGKTKEEREAIREARRRLYDRQAEEAKGIAEPVKEAEGDTVTGDGSGEALPDAGQSVDGEEVDLTREQMISELKAAGQTVHPKIKDETLAKKVEALRNGENS